MGKRWFVAGVAICGVVVAIALWSRPRIELPATEAPNLSDPRRRIRRGEGPIIYGATPQSFTESFPRRFSGPAIVTLAIVRNDSILIPFASFDGVDWFNLWPEATGVQTPAIPASLTDIPKEWWGAEPALRWDVLQRDGSRRSVIATGVAEFQTHCVTNIGLKTDFPERAIQTPFDPYSLVSYVGTAATPDYPLTPVERLDPADQDFETVHSLLSPIFTELEPRVWESTMGTDSPALLTGPIANPVLDTLYRGSLGDGIQLLTFSARRELPKGARDGQRWAKVTRVTGSFIRRGIDPLVAVDLHGFQSDVNGVGGFTLVPFAHLQVDARDFWIGVSVGYEGEAFVVMELTDNALAVRLSAYAGGC